MKRIHVRAFLLTSAVLLALGAVVALGAILTELGLMPWILGLIIFGVVYLVVFLELESRDRRSRHGPHEP